jgi:flagellar protein FlaG
MQVGMNSQFPNVAVSGTNSHKPVEEPSSAAVKQSPATEKQVAEKEPSRQDVESATQKLQKFADSVRGDIQFSLDQDSGKTVVKVIDKQTSDVLMQFPSKEALSMADALEKMQGMLIRQKA